MNRTFALAAVVLIPAAVACRARAETPLLVPVDGKPSPGQLTAVDDRWQLSFTAGGKQRNVPAAELVYWGRCAETGEGPVVVLADAGLLPGDVYRADRESLSVDSDLFGSIKSLPLERVAGVVFHPPADRQQRDRLIDRVARASGDTDRLLLHNGDEVTGMFESIEDDVVRLKTGAGPLDIETGRIAALIFNPALKLSTRPTGLHAWAGFGDGSLLLASRLALGKSSLAITTAGQTWKTSPSELVWLQTIGGRATYLSDLQPGGYRHVPFLDLAWPSSRADRNVTGGRLRSGGRLYLKGLSLHSAGRLTYLLDRPYDRFQAELGIDDSTSGGGSVRFRVYLDGRPKFTSPTIRGGMAPVPVSIDLDGAKRLDLIVDYADRADVLDRANWINARVVK